MVRVAKPRGRVGVVVRSVDLPQWWNVDAPDALGERMTTPPQSVAAKGVADASLYRRPQGRPRRSHLLSRAHNPGSA